MAKQPSVPDVEAFERELKDRPDARRAFEREIRSRPGELRAFEDELRTHPDQLDEIQRAVRRGPTSATVDDAGAKESPSPRPVIPSALGTDVSRFRSTTRRNHYEDEQMRLVLSTALGPDSNAVDVGAHGGTVLQEIERLAPNGRHIAYEPLPDEAARLARRFPRVEVRQTALADKDGEATFVHVTSLSPWSGLRRRPYPDFVTDDDLEEIRVRVERLDDSLPEGYAPSLIKVDVEGAEEWVIRGALRTLAMHTPLVIFEHSLSASRVYGTSSASLHHLLCDEAGYRIFDLAGDGPYTLVEFEESQRQLRWINYMAHR